MTYRARRPSGSHGGTREGGTRRGVPDEAVYVRVGQFGDDKDRVIVRSNALRPICCPTWPTTGQALAGFRCAIDLLVRPSRLREHDEAGLASLGSSRTSRVLIVQQ